LRVSKTRTFVLRKAKKDIQKGKIIVRPIDFNRITFSLKSFAHGTPWKMVVEYYLSCVATSVLRMRLLHAVAFSKKLRWLAQTKVITSKTKTHAENAR